MKSCRFNSKRNFVSVESVQHSAFMLAGVWKKRSLYNLTCSRSLV